MVGGGNLDSSRQSDNEDATFPTIQLRLNLPRHQLEESVNESEIVMMEEDYYFSNGLGHPQSGRYRGGRPGKKWSAFTIACFDLGCSSLAIIMEGKALIDVIVNGNGNFLISGATCYLILSLFWFVASWKLLESAYLRKSITERYQLARFWRITNITLLLVFMLSSVLVTLCLYGSCETGISKDTMQFLQTTVFRAVFVVGVSLACLQRVVCIWLVNKYINELTNELSANSFALRVLQ